MVLEARLEAELGDPVPLDEPTPDDDEATVEGVVLGSKIRVDPLRIET